VTAVTAAPALGTLDPVDAWAVPGQERAVAVLRGAVARREVGHAWAFVGPAGVGQEQAARALAAALNCPVAATPADAPCGVCDVCGRTFRGAHPASWEFSPVGAFHRVDDVRDQWLATAFRTAAEGRFKVLRIIDADRLNEAAANAFLKGLEEPPANTVWVLDIADPDELPDTILSRCRVVTFLPWRPAELEAEAVRLGLADPTDRALAVRAATGSPVALRRFAAPGGVDALRRHRAVLGELRDRGPGFALVAARALDDEVKQRTAALKAEGKAELESLAALYGDKPPRAVARQVEERYARREREARVVTLQAAIDDIVGWCRDCLLVAGGGDPRDALHADAGEALRADAAALGPARLLRTADLLLGVRDNLELNVQQGLALEAVLLQMHALSLEP
jgi:DNA polymerase-3 subunit delta'